MRFDRGPGIDGLATRTLTEWLDDLYRQAIIKQAIAGAPESIGGYFWTALGDAVESGSHRGGQLTRGALERNDHEHKSYLATATVIGSGLAAAGVAGALADG